MVCADRTTQHIAKPDIVVSVLNQVLMWHWTHTRVVLVLPRSVTRARACLAPSGCAVLVRCCMCRAAQAMMKVSHAQ